MLTDKVDSLYNALSDKIDGLGTLDEFRSRMQNPDNQRKFYDFVSNHYDIGTFDDYSAAINSSAPAAPKAEVRQDVIDTAKEAAPADITPADNSSLSYDSIRLLEEERDKLRKVDAEKVAKVNSAASAGGSYSFMPAAAVNMSQKAVAQEVYDKNERLKELDRMISEAYAPIYKQAAAEAKDAAAEALKMRQEISDVQAAELSKAAKAKGVQYSPQGMTMAAQYQAALNPRLQQRESMLQVAADYYRKAAEEYEKPTRFDDTNGFANVGRGALNTVIDRDFFSRGWTEFARASATKPLFDKISQIYKDAEAQQWNEAQISAEVSRQFTSEELRALGGFMSFMDAQGRRAQNGDISLGYQIGQTVGESAGYMLDFAIGNKMFGNAISESVSSVIGSKLPNAAKGTFKHTLNTTVRWAAGASAKTVPLTAVLGSTYANIAEKTLEINPATGNPYTWGEAFCEGLTESYIENFSESSGVAMTGLIKRGLALPLKSKGVRTLVAKIGNEMTRKGLNPKSFRIADSVFGKQLAKELTDMGYNGVVEEWLEELFNAMSMEALGQITGKEAWKGQLTEDFFTKDNQAILWASFAVPGAVPGAARLAHIAKEHRRYRKVKSQIADLFGDKDFAEQEANKVYNLARSSVAVQDENGKTHTKIQRVRLENGTECYIVGGKVAIDDSGKVDINGSDATVYVRNVETDNAGVENISDEVTPISINSNGQRITDVLLNEDYNAVSNNLLQTDYNEYHARRKYPIGDEVIIWRQNDAGELEPTVNEDGSIAYGRVTGFENGNVIIDPLTGEDNVGIPFADAEQMLTSRTEYENIQQQQQESEGNVIEMDAEQQEDKPLGVFDAGSGVQITVRSAVTLADGKRYYMVSIQSPNSEAREGLTTEKDLALSIGAKNAYNVRQEAERRQSAQAEQQAEAAVENTAEAASNATGVIEDTNSPEQTETSEKPAETSEEPAKSEAETEYNRLTTEYGGAEMADTMIANTVANIQKSLDKKQKEYEKAQAELVELGLPFDEESKKKIEKAKQKVADLKSAVDTYNGQLNRFKTLQEYADKTKKQAAPADNTEGSAEASEKGNAENNIEASVESGTDTSVPDMALDKASDARKRGYRMFMGKRYDRQGRLEGVKGKEVVVSFSNDPKDDVKCIYMAIEADVLQPSHLPRYGGRNPLFFLNEGQPKDRTDTVSVQEVEKVAANIDVDKILTESPVAYVGPSVVNMRGDIVQGHNRGNFVKVAYSNYKQSAERYKQALIERAERFGLDAKAVSAMRQPVLVRVADVSDEEAIRLGQKNDLDITTGGVRRINPVNVAKLLGDKIERFAGILMTGSGDEETDATRRIRDVVRSNANEAIRYLSAVGAITPAQTQSMYGNSSSVPADTIDDLLGVLTALIFKDGNERLPAIYDNILPAAAQKAILATAYRDLKSREEDRIIADIQEAMLLYDDMVRQGAFNGTGSDKDKVKKAVFMYRYQPQIKENGNFVPDEFFSNFAFELAVRFKAETAKQLKSFFDALYDMIQGTANDLFSGASKPISKAEAFEKLSRYDTRRTERENQTGPANTGQEDVSTLESGNDAGEQGGRGSDREAPRAEQDKGGVRPADSAGGDSPAGEQKQVKKPARKTSKKKEAGASAENADNTVESIFSDPSLQDDINELSELLERLSGSKYVVPNQDEASKRNSRIEDTLQLLNVGTRITAKVFQLGITRFAKYAEVMIAKFGSSIKPFLKNIYKNSTALLQDMGFEFDSNEYVDGFNIDSLEAPKAEKVKSWSEFIDENLQGSEEITTLADEDEAFNKAQVEWAKANLETITEAYLSTHGNLLDPDEIREVFRPLGYDRTNVEKYRVAEKFLVEQIFKRMLSDANKAGNHKITFLTGVGGSGKSTATRQIKDFGKDSAIVYDSALNKYEKLKALIDQAVEAGVDDVHVLMVHNDAKTAFSNTLNRGLKTNRWLSLDYFIDAFINNRGKVKSLTDNYKNIDVIFYDNSGNNGRFVELEDALKWDYSLPEEQIQQLESLVDDNEQLTEQQKNRLAEEWKKKRLSEVSGEEGGVRKDDSRGEGGLRRPTGERDNVPLIENEAESEAETGRAIGTVSKSKHTKTGEDLFIVVPTARVSNEDFKQLKARAKAHNGYYSSYSKNRGFIFKSEEDAKQFNNISDDELTTDKVSADTQTIETEAGAIISEAEATGGNRRDSGAAEGEPGTESTEGGLPESGNVAMSDKEADKEVSVRQQVLDKIDKHIDKVNGQLAILGYYEAEEDPRMFNESYGYQKTAEQKALKDIERLAKQLADDLGLEVGKRKKLASANIAPAGGEISFSLPLADGKELHLVINLSPNFDGYFKKGGTRDDLAADSMYWRVEDPAESGTSRYLTHNVNYGRYIGESGSKILSVTYSQLLGDIQRIAKNYLPKKDNSDLVGMIGEVAQKERQRKKADKKRIPANEPMMLDLFSGAIEDLNTAAQQEAAHETKDDAHHGYKVGDKVIYRSKGSSKREPEVVEIVDFNYDGRPVLDSFHANWISEIANWEDIEPYNSNDNGNTNNGTETAGGTAKEKPADMGGNGAKSDGGPQAGTTKETSGEGNTGRTADADAGETERDALVSNESGSVPNRGKRGGSTRTAGGVHAGAVLVKDPDIEHGDHRTDDGSLRTPKEKAAPKNTRNYLYPDNAGEIDNLYPSERLKANVEALEVLLTLLKEGREATVEERATLGKLRGWGGVNVPDAYTVGYRRETLSPLQKRLVEVINALDPSGERKLLESLRTASHTSYYTPIPIARAMHAIAEQAGYKGKGNMLDPSMGNGVFEGSMPKGMQQSTNIRGVELDWLTGQVAKHLYPDARINITGFQDAHIPQDYFDYVISNIPFGNLQIKDLDWERNPSPIRKAAQGKIHNYFAVKMIESTRPGGLCVIMTSNAIMDTQGNNIIRKYIDDNCEVLGAVRLPNDTFKGAGTKAVTDVIYLRKFRDAADREAVQNNMVYMTDIRTPFLSLSEKELKDSKGVSRNVKYNDYYHKHPENIIGTPVAGGQYSDEAYDQESDLSTDELAQQLEKIGRSMMDERKKYLGSIITDTTIPREEIKERIKERYKGNGHYEGAGNIVVQDGKIGKLEGVKEGNVTQLMFNEQKFGKVSVEQVTDYTKLRSLLKQLIHSQIENYDSEHIDDVRKQMQQAYTAYTKKYGKLGDKKNAFITEDIDSYQVRALEKWDDGKFVGMADIYTKNTIASERDIADVKDPQTAVLNSLAEYGSINAEYLQSVLGDNFAEACKGLIFEDPSHQGEYIARDVYLSGDVVTKLEYARQIAKEDSRFQENVTALEAVQPKRKEFGEFPCHMGARWIPVQVYNDFLNDAFGIRGSWKGQKTGISYIEATDEYIFNFASSEFGGKASKYATSKKSAAEIFKAALLDKDITVKYKDEDGKEHTDQEATDAARDKVAELRDAFEDWLPLNPERVQLLTDTYNSVFNRHVLPTYNGQHLNVVGLQGMKLRPHQKDAVWRIINQRGGIIDHIVGAGKSLVMQAAIMEMRRMGIAKKPMILALKSTTQQIADEFHQAFPAARILAPSEDDFSTQNRKRFLAQIAVNDYDCIILSHEQYEGLDHTDSVKRSFIEDQIAQLDNLLEYLYGQNDKSQLTTKQIKGLETRKENLKEKLKALDLMRTDEEFIFENLGVDYLFVDECQAFKNLMFQTSYKNIAGLGNPAGSERSTKLLYGVRSLQEMHQGDMGTVFLSGTTISNSLSELYNIFNYLRPNELARMGLNTFDAWASTFAVRSTEAEFGATNELKEKSRFRKFEGVEELSRLYTEIADVRNDHNLELPKPKLHTVFVSIPISDTMKEINDAITALVKNHDGSFFGINPERADKYPWSLQATNLAKMATLSPKLIDPSYDDENGKIFHVCENIKKIYDKFNEQKGTQLVFCDAGVPGPGKKYDAYTDIINRLTNDYGIPRSEIVDIHEADTDEKRQELFKKVNDGKVRILIGGTKNMGTGVNVQKRVVAMHHLDIPWTPADVNQRNGRGSRQGNEVARDYNNNQVDAYYYAVERTLDTYRYQLQDVKGKMIDSFKMANVGVSEFDEGGGDDNMSPAEMVAILSGNPVILEKAKQDKLVDKLKRLQRTSVTEYSRRKSNFESQKQRKSAMESLIRRNADDIEMLRRGGFTPDEKGKYPTTVYVSIKDDYASRRSFDKPKEAGAYIHSLLKQGKKVQLSGFKHIANITIPVTDAGMFSRPVAELDNYGGIKYTIEISDDDALAGVAFRNLLQKVYSNADVYKRSLEEINNKLQGADPGEYSFSRQAELDEALAKKREIDEEYNKLVVSDKKQGKSEEETEKQYDELDYDARNLTDAQQVATDALVDALRDNTGIDVTIATEEEIVSKAGREPQQREMLYTPQGKLYGWAEGNRIFLTPDGLNPNTPIHEYSHLWVKAVRRNNPELYKNLQDLFSRENLPEIWEKLDNDSNYAHLSEEGKLSEVISRFSGEHGAERMEAEAQKTAGDAKSLRERMKNLLREFWNWVGEHLFNIHNFGSREEAADRILYDLLNGTDLQLDTNTPDAADVEFEAWEDRMFSVQSVPQIDKIEDFTHYVDELRKYEENLQAEFGRIRREYQQSVIKNANIFRRLYNKIADYYRPIEHFTRFLRSHGGTLSLSDDPYYDKFLTRGRITTARSNFDKNEWKNLKDALSVLALQGGIKGIAAGIILRGRDANDAYIKMQCTPYDVISLYLQAKDMKEVADMKGVDRGAVGFEEVTGINVETFINMVESSVDPDYIKDLWKKVKACTSFSLKYQHEHGYISKDTLNEYSKREYYVPQRGWRMRALSSYETGYVPDFNNDGSRPYNKALKKAKGRSSLADDPIAYIYSIAMSSIVETEKNISKQKLLKAVRDNINLAEATEGFGFRKVYYVNTGEKDDNGMPIFERTYDKPKKEWIENDKQIREEIADIERDINDEATNLRLNPNLPTATFDALIQRRASLLASLKVAYRAGTNMGVKSMLSNEEKKQHVVRVIENGEEVEVWFTDERLANAMNDNFVYSQSSDVFSSIYNGLSRITRYMSAILTQYNPIWAAWNYLRDFGTMFFSNIVTGDKEYLVPASKLAIGVIPSIARYLYHRDFNSKYGTYLQEFFNEGAETGFSFLSNIDEIGQAIKADVSLNGGGKVRKATEKLLGGLSFLTEMSELSIRLAQFIAMREAGKSATEAAIGAKEISVNFDRKSDLSRMLSPLFSFFNATIQGTNKFYRAIENNSVAKMRLTATGALFFLGGMMNALLAPDDPDEERAWSDYDRMTNILLGPVRIPLPHFLRTFWACGAQTALMMSGQKPIKEGMIDAVHFVLDDILPTQVNLTQLIQYENTTGKAVVSVEDYIQSMSPTTISPIVDIILNRDFMGRKIYKEPYVESQRGKIPQTQLAYRNTNPALQAFTDWLANVSGGSSVAKTNRDIPYLLDVNPGKMQHVISGYSPAIAETLVKFAGAVSDLVSGEGFDVSNIPFLSRAIKPYRAERLQKSLYWEIKGIVDRYEGDYNAYKKSPEKRDKATAKQMMSKDNRRLIRRARKILRTCDPDRRNATKEEIREMYEIKKEVIDAFID